MSRVQEHFVSMSVLNRMAAHRRLDRRHAMRFPRRRHLRHFPKMPAAARQELNGLVLTATAQRVLTCQILPR